MKRKETLWFTHDCMDGNDPRVVAMTAVYKMEGYGCFWKMFEILRAEEDYKYNIQDEYVYDMLASKMCTTADYVKQFLNDCIKKYKLFQTDKKFIWSEMLNEKMEFLMSKTRILSERGRKGGQTASARRKSKVQKDNLSTEEVNKSEAQVELSSSTSTKTVNKKVAHNNTLHNTTIQNTTTTNTNSIIVEDVPVSKNILITHDWETLKQRALDDDMRFVYPYVSSGKVSKQQLASWLTAFNKTLEFQAAPMKSEQDYRKHFANWFKYRDPTKENPEDITPMPPNKVTPPEPRTNGFAKPAKIALAERLAEKIVPNPNPLTNRMKM